MNQRSGERTQAWRPAGAVLLIAIAFNIGGCGRDARLVGHQLRDPEVKSITKYGRTLDESASPKDVVYVLLRAIIEDYDAGDDREAREAALDVEFATAAPDAIMGEPISGRSIGDQERKERLYWRVYHWAPTLGHYRDDFQADFETLAQRMRQTVRPGPPEQAEVLLNVSHLADDAGVNAGAVAQFLLVKESGYWRIVSVGWAPSTRDWKKNPPPSLLKTRHTKKSSTTAGKE